MSETGDTIHLGDPVLPTDYEFTKGLLEAVKGVNLIVWGTIQELGFTKH
jgi:hypothetical protein